MGVIGTFGNVVFNVNFFKTNTISDYKRNISIRIAKHDIMNQKPLIEVIGDELEEITLNLAFHKSLGIDPTDELEKLKNICLNHEYNYLIIGNKLISQNPYLITNISETIKSTDKNGNTINSSVDITLNEYILLLNTDQTKDDATWITW